MEPVLHDRLPFAPWTDPRTRKLPGMLTVAPGDWLRVDEAYAGQMALRKRLIAERRGLVHALAPEALPAAQELLGEVLAELPGLGFVVAQHDVTRPDGQRIVPDHDNPLITLGHLCQNDFCLMQRHGAEHVLTGAILCFPASWTLGEKFLRPLTGIHVPVPAYDDDISRRVQRLFDGIRPGQPMWRANALMYEDPSLFHPRSEETPRRTPGAAPKFLRSERQTLYRLPRTDAVVFGIHTYVIRPENLTPEQTAALREHPIHQTGR